ncbi:F-box/RNI-like superfamily protein [Rhynchospora pubera]|uniref:F-box/RNI-like superfamily protein n=1 Tax=Rhynchospora pubera TaxID=906938 RepID=A0AAV8FGC7_9POAL|nr:F-box/RNI-like superfamily protein [Rhynchospora pubera]
MSCTDRISELDDFLLTHILSFRPTKEAVLTRKLSRRWRNVWASVLVLDFNFADFWSDDIFLGFGSLTSVSPHSQCHDNFVTFIDTVLASRQAQQVDSFRLVWKYQVKPYQNYDHPVRRWILLLQQQRPRVLSIYVQPNFAKVDVPDVAFTCTTLEDMKLQVDNRMAEVLNPAAVNLPHLRRLNIGYFTIKADFMDKLLLGCPNLEELELYACVLQLSQISCGNLKSLVVASCCHGEDIRVSIPSLCTLKVTVGSSQTAGFNFENMSSLVKACVCFLTDPEWDFAFSDSETKILNGLSGVMDLDVVLHGEGSEDMLKHALKNCPNFVNLKIVRFESFKGCLCGCLEAINRLVQHSPVLEDLIFYGFEDESIYIELVTVLRFIVGGHGNCRLVESMLAHNFGSLEEVEELSFQHMKCSVKMMDILYAGLEEKGWWDDYVEGETAHFDERV